MKLRTSNRELGQSSTYRALPKPLAPVDVPTETLTLAQFLIGKILVRVFPDGASVSGRIVETEAYLPDDPASHAFRGPTRRNQAMFGPPARAYVYFIYGSSFCLNVTAEASGVGAAVLLRALEPLTGQATMRTLRGRSGLRESELARGPGNLCRALGVDRSFDGCDLLSDSCLFLASDGCQPQIGTSYRIGISRAVDAPWRFYARGTRAVSGPRALSP